MEGSGTIRQIILERNLKAKKSSVGLEEQTHTRHIYTQFLINLIVGLNLNSSSAALFLFLHN